MKDEFGKIVKRRLEEGRINPPEKIWKDIDRDLDLDMTWQKVESELDIDQAWEGVNRTLINDSWVRWFDGISNGAFILAIVFLGDICFHFPKIPFRKNPI
ncbi:hypothetical protein QWY93_01880 [Echinicola jeungdonensis]|uniref:hypothetical protein n=1 Tax=Echinicola jeungdonensis TaxID=709343 RepID=UPI0025B577B6|nr:hypothetical protein [Echinicola jeungdonensis]MDN3668083.1 hypothetical protein [Echinicola jeungdonensis]